MSTLNVDVLTNQEVRMATAWVNFNGTLAGPIPARDSYNVSSITDNGTGQYTISFAVVMDNANYAVTSMAGNDASVYTGNSIIAAPTTASYKIGVGTGSFIDLSRVTNIVFGGKV